MNHETPTEQAVRKLNELYAQMTKEPVATQRTHRHSVLLWRVPCNAARRLFQFGYTPWRQPDGKFYALKYRLNKEGGTCVRKRGFAERKKAIQYATKWYNEYYNSSNVKALEVPKPKPTKNEVIAKKLEHAREMLKVADRRLKRANTIRKNWNRRVKYYGQLIAKV